MEKNAPTVRSSYWAVRSHCQCADLCRISVGLEGSVDYKLAKRPVPGSRVCTAVQGLQLRSSAAVQTGCARGVIGSPMTSSKSVYEADDNMS